MHKLVMGVFALAVIVGALLACGESTSTGTAPQATKGPTMKPTSQVVHYPPKTLADLHGLAARGDASAVQEFHSEAAGLATCPQPKREVTVSAAMTGQTLAQNLLAYFYAQHLDNNCGSIIFAYHSQDESGNGFTAGRVDLTVSGSEHKLTLDIGGFATGERYTVTY